ncbi:MAG: hypothetical protein PSV35_07195, partial [bacterium]|nr:hypothetical protein [bacterium]
MVDIIESMLKQDISTCQSIIIELKKQLPKEPHAWEEPLIAIIKGIEQCTNHDPLLIILNELPPVITQALVTRMLPQIKIALPCLKFLIIYINQSFNANKAHCIKLIEQILSSPITLSQIPEAQELILKLESREKELLFLKLDSLIKGEAKSSAVFDTNYKSLALFLAVKTLKMPQLELPPNETPFVAHLVLLQLLEMSLDADKEKELCLTLLRAPLSYRWHEPYFRQKAHAKLIAFFSHLKASEVLEYYTLYTQCNSIHTLTNKISFLDELFAANANVPLITQCISGVDDEDNSFTINFLTLSHTHDEELIKTCLRKISTTQLLSFLGHVMALH